MTAHRAAWFVVLAVAGLLLWYGACQTPSCRPAPVRVYVRDTIIIRDTVRIRIPERHITARLPARRVPRGYAVDTTLATGEVLRIAFVEDSLLFDVYVAVPARDTALVRTLAVVPPELPREERNENLHIAAIALALGIVVGVLLR